MGLMDKFKNLFTDEEFEEEEENETIEIKEIKKDEEENKLPTFMREKIEREKQENQKSSKDMSSLSEIEVEEQIKELKVEEKVKEPQASLNKQSEEKSSFKFPIDISDNDFIETRSRQSLHKERNNVPLKSKIESNKKEIQKKTDLKVSSLYKDKKESKEPEEKKFKATPIISPIYGVLNQNYTSGEVENSTGQNFENQRHSKNVDFDSVRKKAYGSLTEEIKENLMCENCEYLKEAKECHKDKIQQEDIDYDTRRKEANSCIEKEITTSYPSRDEKIDYSNITLDEATENYYDYGVEYEKNNYQPSNSNSVKIVNHEEDSPHPKKEIPPVKSSINLLSTLKKSMGDEDVSSTHETKKAKDLELTDDLFNLIDSMYDERNDSND